MSVMVSEIYEALRKIGLDETAATAAAKAVLPADTQADLVTKAYLKAEMLELKADLIKWNVGTLIAMTAIYGGLVATLKLFS